MFSIGMTVRCINANLPPPDNHLKENVLYTVTFVSLAGNFIKIDNMPYWWDAGRFEVYDPSTPQSQHDPYIDAARYAFGHLTENMGAWSTTMEVPLKTEYEGRVIPEETKLKCECGIDSIGGGRHSSYCPKVVLN